ncbi:MAG: NAD(P)H-dependent oxidoreductase [Bacteroidales bacterium]|nr:NAD(P)H-dependent oxidoreductase [Bacteroidales bacterium]
MKITLLDGNPDKNDFAWVHYLKRVKVAASKNHHLSVFDLKELKIDSCIGCWDCWWKTPGRCVLKDDMEEIMKSTINSGLLVIAAPLVAGFIPYKTKTAIERLIPLLHPYIKLVNGECHHRKRYPYYPDMGIILKKESDTEEEDLQINKDIFGRVALNFHSQVRFFETIDSKPPETIAYEIDDIQRITA